VMDHDTLGGDDVIASTKIVITPASLAERAGSVGWHRLQFNGHRKKKNKAFGDTTDSDGLLRVGVCWVPEAMEPIPISTLRPEEEVEQGTLYMWVQQARELRDATLLGQRDSKPPICQIELRPYAKKGRKKMKEVEGAARFPEPTKTSLDRAVWHSVLKLDFSPVDRSIDKAMAETAPTMLVTLLERPLGKKVVLGETEVLLAAICGTNLEPTNAGQKEDTKCDHNGSLDNFIGAEDHSFTLLHNSSRAGLLTARTLFVPQRKADTKAAKAAVKALVREAEAALNLFRSEGQAALEAEGSGGNREGTKGSPTAIPGKLEVYVMRATDLYETEAKQVSYVVVHFVLPYTVLFPSLYPVTCFSQFFLVEICLLKTMYL
jgi:hypothetical protein